jgi:hypothetical protein
MSNPADNWRELASRLGVQVIAPASIPIGNRSALFAALLPQFGAKHGMIAHPDWEAISPHADTLARLGYGFSAVEIDGDLDDESAKEMLRDWGWSAAEPKPSWW